MNWLVCTDFTLFCIKNNINLSKNLQFSCMFDLAVLVQYSVNRITLFLEQFMFQSFFFCLFKKCFNETEKNFPPALSFSKKRLENFQICYLSYLKLIIFDHISVGRKSLKLFTFLMGGGAFSMITPGSQRYYISLLSFDIPLSFSK